MEEKVTTIDTPEMITSTSTALASVLPSTGKRLAAFG